jgi:ABC-2 type transport system permease protein
MMPTLKSEFRKLLTVRSTYIASAIALLLLGFISFWVLGYKGTPDNPMLLMDTVRMAGATLALFLAIISILLMAHEYRHNTIMYTLTASNSRSKVLVAKLAVVVTYTVIFSVFAALFSLALLWIGIEMKGNELAPQQFFYWDTIWRFLFFTVGYGLIGLLLVTLVRHVVGAFATLFLLPATVEPLLSLLLKENSKYLPFMSLDQVNGAGALSPAKGALVFGAYLVGGWLIAWILFLRRDAN